MEIYTKWTFTADEQTNQFLTALRDQEEVNISGWIRDAIRRKAGLTGQPAKKKPASK